MITIIRVKKQKPPDKFYWLEIEPFPETLTKEDLGMINPNDTKDLYLPYIVYPYRVGKIRLVFLGFLGIITANPKQPPMHKPGQIVVFRVKCTWGFKIQKEGKLYFWVPEFDVATVLNHEEENTT